MQAQNFFETKSDKSTQLLLLSKKDFLSGSPNLTSFERNLLSFQQFVIEDHPNRETVGQRLARRLKF